MTAPPTNTFETFAAIGNREDLTDVIYNISPTDTPGISSFETTEATATLHEWQTDSLAAASATNQVEEGLDATTDAVTVTVRLTNDCEISDKVPRVSGTQQAVMKAGRGDELEYQIAKMAKELKTDMEKSVFKNTAKTAGSSGTARVLGGVPTWLTSNLSEGSGATTSTGLGANARTGGTERAYTEVMLKEVLRECFDNGGDPDKIHVGAFNKQTMSGFAGNATREVGAADRQLYAAIDIYDSDFGELQIVPNRFSGNGTAFILQSDLWAIAYLRQFQLHSLAKTGDSERKQLLVEYTLESRNQKGSGAVYDLTTS
jgi:hypothetical protein